MKLPIANSRLPICRKRGSHGFRVGNWKLEIGNSRAFTLIEIMVVVLVMGLLMAMGIPAIYSGLKQEGMRKAVNAVVDACNKTRAQAIMSGAKSELRFFPHDRRMEAGAAGGDALQWPESVTLEMLDVNLKEGKDAEGAVTVEFYPNGTCDELTVIFYSPKDGSRREISLEITTALASVESDPRKFR